MRIAEWDWDERNIAHIARRGLARRDIEDVWRGDPRFLPNKKGRPATHLMLGPDRGGRFLAVFIRPMTDRPERWRVITARPATESERKRWTKN